MELGQHAPSWSVIRTDNTPKVRFSATLGEEPEVEVGLDPDARYGLWVWGKRRQKRWQERGEDGVYRTRYEVVNRPRSEWKVVPVPLTDAAPPRWQVDASRERLAQNGRRPASVAAQRFWELSGGLLRCAHCGGTMGSSWVRRKSGRVDYWYRCHTRYSGRQRECSNTKLLAAAPLEEAIWRKVHDLITHPRRLQAAYKAEIERRRAMFRGDPQREAAELAKRLEKLDGERLAYLRQNARGLLTDEELDWLLADVDGPREGTRRALQEARDRGEGIEKLRREMMLVFARFEQIRTEELLRLEPEDRRAYLALRLRVGADNEKNVRITGVFDHDIAEIMPTKGLYRVSPNRTDVKEHKGVVTLDSPSTRGCSQPRRPSSRAW
jgi:hypothetical protein